MTLTVVGPTRPVDAPQAQPSATGLVSLARRPDLNDADDRWMLGYQYRPEFPSGTVRNWGTTSSTIGSTVGGVNPDDLRVHVIPWWATVDDVNSVLGMQSLDLKGRVTRSLEAYTSRLVAHEFWTGEIAKADGLPNPILASTSAVDITSTYSGPLAPQSAVAALMQALADNGMGDGMIHCSKYVGLRMPDAWRNQQTLEDHGFVVVADAGYPGTGPNDETGPNWAFATEIVNVRLGPIELIPDDVRYAIDKTTNTVTYRAQRIAAVDYAGPVFCVQVSP